MKDMTVEKIDPADMVVLIPKWLVGDGEPGDPLTNAVVHIINSMAAMNYGVLDFGEDHGTHCELHFIYTTDAKGMAAHFIQVGGDV